MNKIKWKVGTFKPPSISDGDEQDRFNNCLYIEQNLVLLSTLYNFYVFDTNLKQKMKLELSDCGIVPEIWQVTCCTVDITENYLLLAT